MFLFLHEKVPFKGAAFAAAASLFLAGLLFSSCEQSSGPSPIDPRVIEILSAEDLAKIGVNPAFPLSGSYRLAGDITLENWLPIGGSAAPFTGVFDGNGRTITLNNFAADALDVKNYLGIFAYVKGTSRAKAAISSLKLHSSIDAASSQGQSAIGLLAGYAEMAEIENITLSGTFTFSSSRTVLLGGATGYISTGVVIRNCSSSLTIDISPGNGQPLLSGTQPYSYIGGIVGVFTGGAGIEDCHNTADVTVDSAAPASQVFTGGIAGGSRYDTSTAYRGYIKDSSSTGNISAKAMGDWTIAGGIAGTIVGGAVNSPAETTRIERCFAAGTVSTAETGSGWPYTGGIAGFNYYGALITQSYFNGTVIAGKGSDYTGGIAGYNSRTGAPGNSRIEDCWSSGSVQGYINAGGIAGQNQVDALISRCYSTAAVHAAEARFTGNAAGAGIGGIAGMNLSAAPDAITGCAALNPSIGADVKVNNAAYGENIYRISGITQTGAGGITSGNYAWAEMQVTAAGEDIAIDPKGRDTSHGEDLGEAKPLLSFYEGIGWDFNGVWKMGDDGYPALRWQ